ncbi:MAG: ClpXP protease specificity-enhancing factor [Betaproteobacteria bacterium]|nr:ClpXP protease specificity-enhancing factor [Betaproteobacteria bacterium]
MTELSTKPYLIRAIYEWCADCGFTPYLSIKVDQNTRVPMEYVKNGEIVLSISLQATRNLTVGNDLIQFSARFNGVSREIAVPVYAVQGVFARENGRGMFFEAESAPESSAATPPPAPTLQSVPTTPAISVAPETASSNSEEPDSSPDKPKGPPRGNLRVIK